MGNTKCSKVQEESIASTQRIKEQEYWLNKLSGEWIKTVFPCDFTKKESGTDVQYMEAITFRFSADLFARIMKLRNGSDHRMFMIIAAALVVLLNKYTESNDIVLGAPVLKQDINAEFINSILVLRYPLRPHM